MIIKKTKIFKIFLKSILKIKKVLGIFFLIFFLNIFFSAQIFATDSCVKLEIKNVEFFGKTSFRANIRDYPCVSKSKILFVSKKSEKYKIIGKVDGWYKIILKNGEKAWIWEKAIILEKNYILTKADNLIVENFTKKIEKIIKKNGENSRKIFIEKLKKIAKKNSKIKFKTILEKIIFNLEKTLSTSKSLSPESSLPNGEKGATKKEKIKNKKIKNNSEKINYDLEKIKKTWISWHNVERKKLGLKKYLEKEKLNISAINWSILSRNKKIMDHKRNVGDSYYDYKKITNWMKNNGVVCKNIYRATYSESIGRAWFSCKDGDCTDEIIKSIRGTFDYFMSEKGIPGIAGAHYRAIMHKSFEEIGFGIAVEKIGKNNYRVYHTTHYCTKVQ